MVQLRTLHLVIGAVGFVVFVLTGQYMHWVHAGLQGMPDGPRMFLRSAHIYLLWSSLLNIVLGCYLTPIASVVARCVRLASSLLVLVGPVLLGVSFFFETYTPELTRPIGKWAIYLVAAGVAGHAAALVLARFPVRAAEAGATGEDGHARAPHSSDTARETPGFSHGEERAQRHRDAVCLRQPSESVPGSPDSTRA